MSWALEAIEKAAMERAMREILSREPTMLGMRAAQVAALQAAFFEKFGVNPVTLESNKIVDMLRDAMK